MAVSEVINHESYGSPSGNSFDFALLKLKSPVTYNDYISPVCLPRANNDFEGHLATVSGWGTTSSGGKLPQALLKLEDVKVSDTVNVALL